MKSFKKKFSLKVWKIIIVSLILFFALSYLITKAVYNICFPRYDEKVDIPMELRAMTDERQPVEFYSGENLLRGHLYGDGLGLGIVIVAPGFRASEDNYLWQINSFQEYGWDVLSFDTTGSCTSEGNSSVGFSQELLDLNAALDYVEKNYNYDNIFIFGHSRGGYAACGLLNSDHRINAVVSVAGINSAMEAVIEPAQNYVGLLAYGNYPFLWLYQSTLFGADVMDIHADEQISDTDVPTLIIQGVNDDVAPIDSSSIYSHKDEISSDCVEYYICDIPGQDGHTDLLFDKDGTANDVLMGIINQFYRKNSAVSN